MRTADTAADGADVEEYVCSGWVSIHVRGEVCDEQDKSIVGEDRQKSSLS